MKKNSLFKKSLSVFLAVLMMLSVISVGIIVPETKLTASAAEKKSAASICGDLTFVVPETIYLAPMHNSSKETTSASFQHYLNNDANGSPVTDTSATTGKIYYTYSGASTATVTYKFYDATLTNEKSGGSVTLSSNSISSKGNISITGGLSPELSASETGCYIEWQISFVDTADSKTKTAYAYTYIYKPYVVPIASGIRSENTKGTHHFAQSLAWITGFNSISGTAGYYTKYSVGSSRGFSAFLDSVNYADETSNNGTLFDNASTKSTNYKALYAVFASTDTTKMWFSAGQANGTIGNIGCTDFADGSNNHGVANFSYSSKEWKCDSWLGTDSWNWQSNASTNTGNIYVDTSRFTNLAFIPNLGVGIMGTDNEEAESNHAAWYIAQYSGSNDSSSNGTQSNNSDNCVSQYNDKGTMIAGAGTSDGKNFGYALTNGVVCATAWDQALASTSSVSSTQTYKIKAFYGNNDGTNDDSDYCYNFHYLYLSASQYNKSALRTAVNNATKIMAKTGVNGSTGGMLTSMYFDADTNYKWSAFQSAYKNAVIALTKVDGAVSDVTALANTLNNAIAALCTKVTVDGNGGTLSGTSSEYKTVGESVDVKQSFTYTPICTASRTGYTFKGWSVNKDAAADAASASVIVGYNDTVYAIWEENIYTATFNYDNIPAGLSTEKTVTTANYTINTIFYFPEDCQKNYYTFNDTWKCTTGGGAWNVSSSTLYGAGDTSEAGKYGDVTFTAQYTPFDYYITFDTVNGTAVTPNYKTDSSNTYKYNYESTDTLPAITRLGYTFVGWKPTTTVTDKNDATLIVWNQNTVYPAGTSLNHRHDNVTLVAQWKSVTSTVTLNIKADETYTGNTTLNYAYSSSLELNNPTKTGYTFMGWKVTGVPTSYSTDIPEANRWIYDTEYLLGSESYVTLPASKVGNVTLEAMWTPITYTVTYNSNGGTAVSPKTFNIKESFNLGTPTYSGYDFTGWTVSSHDTAYNWTDSSYSGGQSVSGKYGNVTLYANWQAKNYTVTLDVNGGDAITPNTRSYNIEGATALPTPTRTGYSFDGWKVTATDASSSWGTGNVYTDALPAGEYGALTLTAQWTHTAYTITLNSTGTNAGDRTYYVDSAAFTLGESALAGYSFAGWKVNSTAGNWTKDEVLSGTTTVSGRYGDVALTAQFNPVTYTITYKNKDGGTLETVNYDIEDTVTLRDYSVNGYTFGGWQVESVTSGGGWSVDGILSAGELSANMYYGNVVLAPVMTANEYTVTFIPNGGTAYAPVTYTVESTDTLPTSTKTGYDFAGWKVTVAGGSWTENAVFNAGEALTGKYGNVTLTATWTPKKYTITYFTGTYPSGITKQGTFGQTAPDLTDSEKAKPQDEQYTYTFDKWSPVLATVTGETSYTAQYTKTLRSYDITWMLPDDLSGTLGNYTSSVTPNVNYGETPVYNNGVNPSLTSDKPDDYSWRFTGWSLTQGGTVLDSIPTVTGTATYYAVFTKVQSPEEVNWVIDGVTNTELWGIGETPSWNHDTPTKPDADGYKYTFTGWTPTIVPVVEDNTYTYTAQFSKTLQTYTCKFDADGGEMSATASVKYKMGNTITFPTPTKTGYTFSGWLIDAPSGTWTAGTLIPAGDYVTNTLWGNVSFTAQWTPVTYTISYLPASADDVLPESKNYTIESTDGLGTATREGYDLAGWVISAGEGTWTQGSTVSADYTLSENWGNVTLTPVWQIKTYIIHWISDGAEQTSEVEYGSAILAIPPSSKMGYTTDWDAEVPATMPAHDLYFNAVYTPVQYYIRVNVNGGSAVDNFYYTINGDDVLPSPTRDGATFAGWKVTAAQGNWSKNMLIPGGTSLNGKYGNVTLTAQWTMRTCTVIWEAGDITKTTTWYYGAVPSYSGTPYKSPDAYNSYVFTGWDKEITAVTEDEVTYTALFEATERIYTVTWNVDGVTTKQEYGYGDTPVYSGATPERAETSEYVFTFSGWSPELTEVKGDVTYIAQFDVFTKIQGLSLATSAVFLDIDETETLKASIYPSTATVRDVVWTSLNTDVATVNNGIVTAKDAGMAIIKVSSIDGSFSSYCAVTVNARITSYVEISANGISTTQLPGTSIQLTATVMPDNATKPGIVWTSSSPYVASVSSDGLVTYNNAGTATITATSKDGYSVGSITVVTATEESEVEETVNTYLLSFAAAGTVFTINGKDYETLQVKVKEGTKLQFTIKNPDVFYVNVNSSVLLPDDNGVYTIDSVDRNLVIITLPLPIGSDVVDETKDENDSPSFWAKVQAFFKKIVAFFRNLFK